MWSFSAKLKKKKRLQRFFKNFCGLTLELFQLRSVWKRITTETRKPTCAYLVCRNLKNYLCMAPRYIQIGTMDVRRDTTEVGCRESGWITNCQVRNRYNSKSCRQTRNMKRIRVLWRIYGSLHKRERPIAT